MLEGKPAITCRPADLLEPELATLTEELRTLALEKSIALTEGEGEIDDVLTYALFPQIGLNFLEHRGDPSAFEPAPTGIIESAPVAAVSPAPSEQPGVYTVKVNGQSYVVEVAPGGDVSAINPAPAPAPAASPAVPAGGATHPLDAPLAGNIFHVNVIAGDTVEVGDVIVVLEAMKMETEVRAQRAGVVAEVMVKVGDKVAVGDPLISVA